MTDIIDVQNAMELHFAENKYGVMIKGVNINFIDDRIEWNSSELEDNIFIILGYIGIVLGVRIIGEPYEINSDEYDYAIDFEAKNI